MEIIKNAKRSEISSFSVLTVMRNVLYYMSYKVLSDEPKEHFMTDFEKMVTKKSMQDYIAYLSYKVGCRTGMDADDVHQELMLTAWKEYEKFKAEKDAIKYILSGLSFKAGKIVFLEYKKLNVRRKTNPVVYNSIVGYTESEEDQIMAKMVLEELKTKLSGRQLTVFTYLEKGYKSTEIQIKMKLHPYTYSCTLKKIQTQAEELMTCV
jgi:hypothetical protein